MQVCPVEKIAHGRCWTCVEMIGQLFGTDELSLAYSFRILIHTPLRIITEYGILLLFSSFQSATSACVKGIRQLGTKLSLGLAGTLNDVIWHSAAAPRRNIFRETRGRVGPHLLQWFTNCLAAAVCVVALSCKRKRCTAFYSHQHLPCF